MREQQLTTIINNIATDVINCNPESPEELSRFIINRVELVTDNTAVQSEMCRLVKKKLEVENEK